MSEVFADEAAVEAALGTALDQDGRIESPELFGPPATPVATEQALDTTEQNTQVDAGTNQSSESFTDIDISSVPEELRPAVEAEIKKFQADYTRKTQEVAPFRQMLETSGMSAEEAQQALTFVQNLNDPDQLRALYDHLQTQFEEAEEPTTEEGGEVDPRDQELKSVSERLEKFEKAQAMSEAKSALDSSVTSVKSAYPDFKDDDITRVQQLAISHMQANPGADIATAMDASAKEFASWREEVLTAYIQSKGQVTTNGTPVLGDSAHAETPQPAFANLDEATKAAMARFGNSI